MRPTPLLATLALLAGGLTAGAAPAAADDLPAVHAGTETPPNFDDEAGGNANADDPAIWHNHRNPAASLIIATVKEGGLRVYDLAGREVQSLPAPPAPNPDAEPGRYNNVDLLSGFPVAGHPTDIAVVSDRGRDRLRIYRIDPGHPRSPLTDITAPEAPRVYSPDEASVDDQFTAYGLATWRDRATGRFYAVASQRHATAVALLELTPAAGGTVSYRKVRTLTLPGMFELPNGEVWTPCEDPGEGPQVEGMVVDPDTATLYAGQEDVGIWRITADLTGTPRLVDTVAEYGVPATFDPETEECVAGPDPGFGGRHLHADVEGLTIYRGPHGTGYLLASSQGDNTFAIYSRTGDNRFLTSFRIAPGSTVDGSEVCDGAAVLNLPLGPGYPQGLLAVQDGQNGPDVVDGDGEVRENTNLKYVDWRDVVRATGLS